jgi:threonine-phosphate decarboxylase
MYSRAEKRKSNANIAAEALLATETTHANSPIGDRKHLFYETSHSPALTDLVGYEKAKEIVDFCFIANPYYPTPGMLEELQRSLPNLIKSYPSSNPLTSQSYLAEVLHVDPERLVIGNGATELIALITQTLIDRIAVPIPTFGEYIEKMRDARNADLYPLDPEQGYELHLDDYLAWADQRKLECLLIINPGNPTGQFIPLEKMVEFLRRARHLELVIVDESFIDFAGDPIPSLLPFADQFTNLLIVRSMSKHCGVPGLRLGYCCSSNTFLLNRLRRFIPTWNLNTLAQHFLSLLPGTNAEYHEGRKRLMTDVKQLYEDLRAIPHIKVYPTGANFLLFKVNNGTSATELQARLLVEHGMYVRDCSNKIGMDALHIRVASQGREKDARLVGALRTCLQ